MEITLEKIDLIRERTGLTYKEAKETLERNNGSVVDALIELESRKDSSWREEFSSKSNEVIERLKELIHEGNITKIRIKSDHKTLAEIPVTIGAIGAVILPQLAALGVLIAVFKRCTIEVVKTSGETDIVKVDDKEDCKEDEKVSVKLL